MNKKNISENQLFTKQNLIRILAIIAVYIICWVLINQGILSRQYRGVMVLMGINIILAVSLNLVTGFLGELSLGHAGFMMIGAYAGAIFSKYLNQVAPNLPSIAVILPAILLGGLFTALIGVLIGIPVLRLKGDYLAIVTLAFGEIIRSICENLKITNGAAGLNDISYYTNYKHFIYVYILMIGTIVIISNLIKSRHGRAIIAVRENAIAAESVGINLAKYKVSAFVLAAFFAGMAGVIHAHNQGNIFPQEAGYNKSIDILVIVVLGGMGSIKGSIIAAVILTLLPEFLRDASDYRQLLYAVVLIIMMILNSSEKFVHLKEKLTFKFSNVKLQKKGE